MIEVAHNEFRLQSYARIKVRNLRLAQKTIQKLMDTKRARGMRLRHSYDFPTNSVYLEARTAIQLKVALRCLREDHNVLFVDQRRLNAH